VTRRAVIAAILAICLIVPALEIFDRWDHTFQDGNDTEADLVVAALCVGVALAIGTTVIVARIRALASGAAAVVVVAPTSMFFPVVSLALPFPTSRPPTPLRV